MKLEYIDVPKHLDERVLPGHTIDVEYGSMDSNFRYEQTYFVRRIEAHPTDNSLIRLVIEPKIEQL